jgi:hypothetical protein
MFQREIALPSSGSESKPSITHLHSACLLMVSRFDPGDSGNKFLRKVGGLVLCPRALKGIIFILRRGDIVSNLLET